MHWWVWNLRMHRLGHRVQTQYDDEIACRLRCACNQLSYILTLSKTSEAKLQENKKLTHRHPSPLNQKTSIQSEFKCFSCFHLFPPLKDPEAKLGKILEISSSYLNLEITLLQPKRFPQNFQKFSLTLCLRFHMEAITVWFHKPPNIFVGAHVINGPRLDEIQKRSEVSFWMKQISSGLNNLSDTCLFSVVDEIVFTYMKPFCGIFTC